MHSQKLISIKMILAIVLVALVAGSHASKVSYEGYKVFRVTPHTIHHQRVLENLQNTNYFDVWKSSPKLSQPWDIMVEPKLLSSFESSLMLNRLDYTVLIQNVEATLNKDVSQSVGLPKTGRAMFQQYNRWSEIETYIRVVAWLYPEVATIINIGQTSEGRDILGLKISRGGSGNPAILVDCGIHAREWLAPAQGQYIIQELVENPDNAHMIENVDWYIIPVLNIDGYEYTFTHDNMWRKTRSEGSLCSGVDGNRNFGFHWNEIGASDFECSDTFAGPRAFSEPETRALRDFALQLENVKMYLTFHSYGEYILYPWGYTSDYPDNHADLQRLGEKASDAIRRVRGTEYTVGSSTNVLYPAAGGSDDWMLGVAGIPMSFTLELPGLEYGFQPPAREIEGAVIETFEGIRVFHEYVEEQYIK